MESKKEKPINLLVAILTSNDIYLAKRAYNSIILQYPTSNSYIIPVIYLIVNSINKQYIFDILEEFKDCQNIKIIETKSNGKPGKGHNSCIQLFKDNTEYDYLTILDGDDMFYPCAFQIYEAYIKEIAPDILHLMCNDKIRVKCKKDILDWDLSYNFKMTSNFTNNNALWYKYEKILKNPFEMNILDASTPSRIILFSRNIFNSKIEIRYSEKLSIFDDMIAFLNMFEAFKTNQDIKIIGTGNPNIYCYNMLNDNSVSKLQNITDEDFNFRQEVETNKLIKAKKYDIISLPQYVLKDNKTIQSFTFDDKIKFIEKNIINDYINHIKKEIIKTFEISSYNRPKSILRYILNLYEKLIEIGFYSKEIYQQALSISSYLNERKTTMNMLYLDKWSWKIDKHITKIYFTKKSPKVISIINKEYLIDNKKESILIFLYLKDKHFYYNFNECFKDKYNLIYMKPSSGRKRFDKEQMNFYPITEYYLIINITNLNTFIYSTCDSDCLYRLDLTKFKKVIYNPIILYLKDKECICLYKNYEKKLAATIYSSMFHKVLFCKVINYTTKGKDKIIMPYRTSTNFNNNNETYLFVNIFSFEQEYFKYLSILKSIKQNTTDLKWYVFFPEQRVTKNMLSSKPKWVTIDYNTSLYKEKIKESNFHLFLPIDTDKLIYRKELLLAIENCNIIFTFLLNNVKVRSLLTTYAFYFKDNDNFGTKISTTIDNIYEKKMISLYKHNIKNHMVNLLPTKKDYIKKWESVL